MNIFNNEVTLENRPILEEFLFGYDYKTSGLSYSSLYMWRKINNFRWEMVGDYLCISGLSHLELEDGIECPFMFPPLTRTGNYDGKKLKETLYMAKERFEEKEQVFNIRLMPIHMLDILRESCPGEMKYTDDRPNYDYLYLIQDMIDLKGRPYHGKKNHLNYFINNYEHEYIELTSKHTDEAMEFIHEFNARKDVPPHEKIMLEMEAEAMQDVFENLEKVGYLAGAIRIDGKIEAIAIGGQLNRNTITEHVEKANVQYRGLYQMINHEFCKAVGKNFKFINREEDMGIPNLRKAKLSYKPVKLVEKYIITCKED
ncbi:MAG: phosphatidylglycerol lysyltransferase domain-containing protein [Anaerovoracaceae bacterium]|jgi:hypothetical protein|nr:phosphatidylglycerol lysyltransferase domain-containing protein [Anaerovoracaceae bacterium]